LLCALLVQDDVGCFHRELPAVRHRVASIHDQVHDHLFDAAAVDAHLAERPGGQ